MAKRSTRDHDFVTVARRVVEYAIGEKLDGSPLPLDSKDPKAIARGRLGGKVGGRARANSLSRTKRKEIAKKAAKARWNPKT